MNKQFSQESDDDLLIYMCLQKDARVVAEEALVEFYHRHKDYVFNILKNKLGSFVKSGIIEEIHNDIFLKVFLKADTYKPSSNSNVRSWLGRIAQNSAFDWGAKHKRESNEIALEIEEWNGIELGKKNNAVRVDHRKGALTNALLKLSDRDREILLISMDHYDPEKQNIDIPPAILEELCKRHKTTRENIRQIRNRAKKKVEKYLKEHTPHLQTESPNSEPGPRVVSKD
ncbi:MAG: RNA polymerase sigma factor [Calditrichia bacterium]